jgi:ABC-type lipoprotein release transport system permease subunit
MKTTTEKEILKMNHTLTVSNAYGRDFKSKREILEHYNANKDFQNLNVTVSGAIVNKQDAKKFKVGFLRVRYKNLMNIAMIDVLRDKFI